MFKVLGVYSAIGSLLYPAKQLGWTIVGNIEPRKGFHSGTFELNFPGIFKSEKLDTISLFHDTDIIIGLPTCRFYSQAGFQFLSPEQRKNKRANFTEIDNFQKAIKTIRPRMFIMENVPDFAKYHKFELNDYKIIQIIIANCDYGNPQLRRRLWIIGHDETIKFNFLPASTGIQKLTSHVIGDLPYHDDIPGIQHVHRKSSDKLANIIPVIHGIDKKTYSTVGEIAKYSMMFPTMHDMPYINKNGEQKRRIGILRLDWNRRPRVLSTYDGLLHPETGYPLTIRERARIQGFPDTFKFIGTYQEQLIQTGACVPLEFPTYLYKLIQEQNS